MVVSCLCLLICTSCFSNANVELYVCVCRVLVFSNQNASANCDEKQQHQIRHLSPLTPLKFGLCTAFNPFRGAGERCEIWNKIHLAKKKKITPYLAFALANYIMHSLFPWSWLNTWNRTLITVLSALAKNWIVHIKSTYPNNWTEFTLEFSAVVRRSLALRSSSFYWHCLE